MIEPYEYKRLFNFLENCKLKRLRIFSMETLCQSIGGIDIPIITISANKS
jgi:hypothetical protein